MKVGFIGVGSMATAIIPNLLRAGHSVAAWNRTASAIEAFDGVTLLEAPSAAFDADATITMLADDAAVRSVLIEQAALQGADGALVHVIMSTISPTLVQELTAHHQKMSLALIAAPVFGVPAVAAKRELQILAAGPARAIDVVQPIFDAIGHQTWRLGSDPVHAMIAKIAGNMMIMLAIESMGEAAALVERWGLPAADFLEILTNTLLASPSYQRYGGNIAQASYEPGFKLTLGLKDVDLALDAARDRGAALPAAHIVRASMAEAVDQGLGQQDWSALAEVARRRLAPAATTPKEGSADEQ